MLYNRNYYNFLNQLCMHAKSFQSCPTLCNPMDYSLLQLVRGFLQARILVSAALSSSKGSSWPRDQTHICYNSRVGRQVLCHESYLGRPKYTCEVASVESNSANPCAVALQAPLSIGFCRQEYWSGLPCPPPGDLPNWGVKPMSLMSPELAGRFFTMRATSSAPNQLYTSIKKRSPEIDPQR